MHDETFVRDVVWCTIQNRLSMSDYREGALERVLEGLDLSLSQDRLLSEIERRLKLEERANQR